MKEPIYLDHNATSPLRKAAQQALLETLALGPLNPSSAHGSGQRARRLLEEARERVAASLGAKASQVLWTSGGTEAINLALFGVLRGGSRVCALATEHPAVLGAAQAQAREVTLLGVDAQGRWNGRIPEGEVHLVAVQAANSETGTLQDLPAVRRAFPRSVFLVDAVQALGKIPVRPAEWGGDLLSFSAHKVGGPAGVGLLLNRTGRALRPMLHGGGQEDGQRAGTESVAAIVAASLAIEEAVREQEDLARRHRAFAQELFQAAQAACPGLSINGLRPGQEGRLEGTVNLALPRGDGRVLVMRLDLLGLQASAGSACSSGSLEPSPVLLAMGQDPEAARRGLRLSMGWSTTRDEISLAAACLREALAAQGGAALEGPPSRNAPAAP